MNTILHIHLIWLIALLASSAQAQLVAYESFSGLPVGSGVSGSGADAFGWSAGWTGNGVSDSRFKVVSPAPPLSYQISGGGVVEGGDRALQLSTAPEPAPAALSITRGFPNQNTTVYLSFLMRVPASGTGSDQIELNLLNGGSVIRTIRFTPNNPAPPVGWLGVYGSSGGLGFGVSGDSMQTHLVVFKLVPNSGYSFWIDPAYGGHGNWTTSGSGSIPAVFDGLSLNIASADSAGPSTTVIVDEFRLGYTWSDVVLPPPAPALVPDVAIAQAVKVHWLSESGKNYQVQYSHDLATWLNFGSVVSGNGQIKEVFDSMRSGALRFYRVQVQ